MGSFSWLKADTLTNHANIAYDAPFKFLIPKQDELSLEVAKEKNDKTLCDCVVVKVYYDFSAESYSFIPDKQQWYKDFVNNELAKYNKSTAREMIEDTLKKKREKTYNKE